MKTSCSFAVIVALLLTMFGGEAQDKEPKKPLPRLVGHRGLFSYAPENTLAGFGACIDLRLGFELDIRRSRDGTLVCLHDDDVKRTTDGAGKVDLLNLADLRKLDAGARFDAIFAGQRVPTLDEVFALLKSRQAFDLLIALDFKIEDETVEAEVVALAKKHGVLPQVVCIGTAIKSPQVRRKLRSADAKTPIAVLAQTADELEKALAAADADWAYLRFVPSAEQVQRVHQANKRVFVVGPTVAGLEPENWRRAQAAGVDALLTDYPLECRLTWRAK